MHSKTASAPLPVDSVSSHTGAEAKSLVFTGQKIVFRNLLMFGIWMILAATPLIIGYEYYSSPLQERPYLEQHESFKPSGLIGQGLGVFGALMMLIGVSSYMIRKRWGWMARFGTLRSWLTFHIFLCTLGPFYVLLHTTFKFGNIASISFWSMAIVVFSGIFGRYVYVRIPKTLNGQFLSPQAIWHAQVSLGKQLQSLTGLSKEAIVHVIKVEKREKGVIRAFLKSISFEFTKKSRLRGYEAFLDENGVMDEVKNKALALLISNDQLKLRMKVLGPFVSAFGYWHVFHIPLALVMLAALLIHIGISIAFGYTWIF